MGGKTRRGDTLILPELLRAKVPQQLLQAEKVTSKITGKKPKRKYLQSTKYKAAISNYRKAVTRKKRADTLLAKNHKILLRYIKKYES